MTSYPGGTVGPGVPDQRVKGIAAVKFWAGASAAALVTALSALVVTLIVRAVDLAPLAPPWLVETTMPVRFAILGFVAALVAAALLYLLLVTTPGGDSFFGWIVGLLTLAAVVLPFVYDATTGDRIATSLVHLAIGLPILGLLPGVGDRAAVWK
ncbi:DUF6069 family protein [Rhodococcus sp. NPDC127528]|uniref:DUF6069 family protein n=1 Tax=unclassified Rhodococcus (in: high G+C Gram-positive bacteria) TaxID=192944 RepID=UPI00363F5FD9